MFLKCYFDAHGPGAALGIVRDGGAGGYQECFGLADIAARTPITPHAAFDLASVTKVFTASAVLLLEQRGQLRLDDAVSEHIPGCPAPPGRPIAIRDLLWHTSGLPDYLHEENLEYTTEAVLHRCRDFLGRAYPGREYDYSNSNYFLLGAVIAFVSGTSYADFLHTHLFAPFGLTDTFVLGWPGWSGLRVRGYSADGYGVPRYESSELDLPIFGDGGVFSSLTDMLRWLELLFSGNVLGREALARAMAPGRLDDGSSVAYGGGMRIELLEDGTTWCGHTGGWHGTTAYFGRFIEERISVVVLTNERSVPVTRIAQRALANWRGGTV